jgi:hypothetical protein
MTMRLVASCLLASIAVGCSTSDSAERGQTTEESEAQPAAAVEGCRATKPNGNAPPGEPQSPRHHGSGSLWTILYYPALLVTERNRLPDGSISEKFPWWRGVTGQLTIRGQRVDGSAPPLRAEVPPGYGDIGFQATSIIFPTEGCWRVTGTVANTSLTFVVLVKPA